MSVVGCREPRTGSTRSVDDLMARGGEELDRLAGAKAVARLKPFHQPPPSFHPFAWLPLFHPLLVVHARFPTCFDPLPFPPSHAFGIAAWNYYAAGVNSLLRGGGGGEVFLVSFETHEGEEKRRNYQGIWIKSFW